MLNIGLLILIALVETADFSSSVEFNNQGEWKLVRSSDEVLTYVRWIETEKNIKTRERKGEMLVECTLEEIINILSDTKSSAKWMENILETHDLKRVNSNEWFTYTLFDIPWPFNNRDLVSNVKLKSGSKDGSSSLTIVSMEDYIPPKSKTVRLSNYTANWYLKYVDSKQIKITFTAITDSPPIFPRWIQDPIVENMFHNNLVSLKKYTVSQRKDSK